MKLYNNKKEITNKFYNFFKNFTDSKNLLKFLSPLFCSLINSESVNFSKIASKLFEDFNPDVKIDSHNRRISRFLNNYRYNIHSIFDKIVIYSLSNFKLAHSDTNVHVSFDHMFSKEKFTVLMFTLRIGRQGIPIYFKCFYGKKLNENYGAAFKINEVNAGIKYCHDLIKSVIPDANIIFLADRWFGNLFPLMYYINYLGDTFVMRCKSNMLVFYKPNKENHKVWMNISDLPHFVHHSAIYKNLEFTRKKFVYHLVYSKSINHKEPWLLITNGDPKKAMAFYGYRFGSIEFLFKSQKSNGFYLEKTGVKSLHTFDNLYSLVCIACFYLTCLGSDISSNPKCYKNLGITITKKRSNSNRRYRCISRFRVGLYLFHMAFNTVKYFRLPTNFKLYDT